MAVGKAQIVGIYRGDDTSELLLDKEIAAGGYTIFHMKGGDDAVVTPLTGDRYRFSGGDGNDYFLGDVDTDVAFGGDGTDQLEGYDGRDVLYGGAGEDDIWGGNGSDRIYGGSGDDWLDGAHGSFARGRFFDADGKDRVYGDEGNDTIWGRAGDDLLSGGDGNDRLDGAAGRDALSGGAGNDTLIGGAGKDELSGGGRSGKDTFIFLSGSSGIRAAAADEIADWNTHYDAIEMETAGTAANYREAGTGAGSIWTAAAQAERQFTGSEITHVFLYNSDTDVGYLLSDLDDNGTFDTGVVLKGAGAATDFNFGDII